MENFIFCALKEWLAFFHSPLSVYWLITKIKYLKCQGVSQRFLNASTKKAILEWFSMHYNNRQVLQFVQKIRMFFFWWSLLMLLIKLMGCRWWKLRVDSINRKIVECLGSDVATKLPQIHAITEFGTTSSVMLMILLFILSVARYLTWSVATTWIGFWTWIWSTRHGGLG